VTGSVLAATPPGGAFDNGQLAGANRDGAGAGEVLVARKNDLLVEVLMYEGGALTLRWNYNLGAGVPADLMAGNFDADPATEIAIGGRRLTDANGAVHTLLQVLDYDAWGMTTIVDDSGPWGGVTNLAVGDVLGGDPAEPELWLGAAYMVQARRLSGAVGPTPTPAPSATATLLVATLTPSPTCCTPTPTVPTATETRTPTVLPTSPTGTITPSATCCTPTPAVPTATETRTPTVLPTSPTRTITPSVTCCTPEPPAPTVTLSQTATGTPLVPTGTPTRLPTVTAAPTPSVTSVPVPYSFYLPLVHKP
jgi:hypothetical protein